MFDLDPALLDRAGRVFSRFENIYWLIGGSGAGKTTLCGLLSEEYSLAVYDMDAHVFGAYMGRYDLNLHPASSAWFSASDPMNWSLSLPWSEFDAMYRAANAEHISLLAEDLAKGAVFEPLLVDGGITHPSVLAQVMPVERIICLTAPDTILENTWELSEERQAMKRYVLNLEDGQNKWQKFLQFDRLLWKKMMDESEKEGIPILRRDIEQTEHLLSALAADSFGFSRSKKSAETGNQS